MRQAALLAAMMASLTAMAQTQDVGGRVIDENGQPLPFVNVVMLSLPDSAFVQGAVTDEHGVFRIPNKQEGGLLRLTCIGYETMFLPYQGADNLTIRMKEETQKIGEVVVKSPLPQTHA